MYQFVEKVAIQCMGTANDRVNVAAIQDSTAKNVIDAYLCLAVNMDIAMYRSSAYATKDGMVYFVQIVSRRWQNFNFVPNG